MPSEPEQPPDSSKIALCCGCGGAGGASGAGGVAGEAGGAGRVERAGLWRAAAAEATGSALLVLLTCSAPLAHSHRALASGLIVAMLVQCFDDISGAYFNPAVTLAAVVWGREGRARGALLGAAQLAGAALGAALRARLGPCAPPQDACLTLPDAHLHVLQAVLLEAVGGACLSLANCASWDASTRGGDSWPLRIGAAVAALTLALGGLTGASMNPARSFGPALLTNYWQHHWVYWMGPLCGAGVATLVYSWMWRVSPRDPRKPPAASRPGGPGGTRGPCARV